MTTTATFPPTQQPADETVGIAVIGQSELLAHGLPAVLAPFAPQVEVTVLDPVLALRPPRPVVFEPAAPMSSQDRLLLRRVVSRGWLPVAYAWPGERAGRRYLPCAAVALSRGLGGQDLHAELRRLAGSLLAGDAPEAGGGVPEQAPAGVLRSLGSCSVPVALSAREREMVELIALGLSNDEIAQHCYVTVNTVKTFIRSAYRKIGVTRRTQAVAWALEHGLVEVAAATGLTAASRPAARAR